MCGKVDDMWRHLEKCKHVSDRLKELAKQDILVRQQKKIGKENARTVAQRVSVNSTPFHSRAASWNVSPTASLSSIPISPLSTPLTNISNQDKRECAEEREIPGPSLPQMPIMPDVFYAHNLRNNWTQQQHEEFAAELCMLMVVCNIAWWSVEQPYWRYFFDKWMPGSQMPGRREMSGRILDEEADKVVGKVKGQVSGRFGTGLCDGWKNVSKSSLVTSMINVAYKVSDQHLLELLKLTIL